MAKPTPRSVRRTLSRLTGKEQAKLVQHGFGPLLGLTRLASEREGAALVESVLALHTRTGYRPPRPEDEANAAEAKRRQRRFAAEIGKSGKPPGRPPMGPGAAIASWALIWSLPLVVVPAGMLVMTATAYWVFAVVMLGTFFLTVFTCGFIASRGHLHAWLAILPIILVMIGVVGATSPLYLKYKGKDVQGEFVRAWTTGKGTRSEHQHCLVAYDDAGTRREVSVDGCPSSFYRMSFPKLGEHVPVHFVLSPGAVKSHIGTKADQKATWQTATAGTGLVLLALLTGWGLTSATRTRRPTTPKPVPASS
ncbi:hypothetical protein [Actinomadura rupiterrae]|uniref:hypothetical protein n=1 Tax=Actinomadura rupiterrae TaxID=559627 RepID=UPI0020A328D8|nr:hypothetical protein [Actinomadura rupiterrae]MCP2336622.1 hypothetical protein [Actinomadura rupiterrae]